MNSLPILIRSRFNTLKNFSYKNVRYLTTSDDEIVIPKRIPRGPTDILRALESTVGRDPTAAHYKYHDDPFLIPMSNTAKRVFAMSQESGRKAAAWIKERHADLFQHKEAEPMIKAFAPKIVYNEKSDVSEDDLRRTIEECLMSDAITVYKLCKEKGVEISKELNQSFLEFLCFYNCKDSLNDDFIEEKWYMQSGKGSSKPKKTWIDGSLAEELFISIENPDGAAYSAIIQGMGKHYQTDRAYELYKEAQTKGITLDIEAHNEMIRVANHIMDGYDKRWSFIVEIINNIKMAKLRPNLNTLNCILEAVSMLGSSKTTKEKALQTLAEFKRIGIEPSLGSWYFVLNTFCKSRGQTSTVLYDILTEIEGKDMTIRHLSDVRFFITAMDVARNHNHDPELAKRLHNVLMHGKNYDLIGDSYKESIYYRNYFILLSESEPLSDFMENLYFKMVPHIYIPEVAVMVEILNMIDLNGAIDYVPKLWSDIKCFDMQFRENVLAKLTEIMTKTKPQEGSDLTPKFAEIAWEIFTNIEKQDPNRTMRANFTAELLSNILILLLRGDEFEKASDAMEKLDKGHHNILGTPKLEAMRLFVDYCIKEKAPSKAVACVLYTSEHGFQEAEEMASKLNTELTLNEEHARQLRLIVGGSIFQQDEQ